MKTSFKILALAALSMGVMSAYAQDAVTLKRTYTNGAVEKYTLTSMINSSTDLSAMGQGEQTMVVDSTMDATFTYSGVKEDGSALVSFLYNNIKTKTEAEGPMGDQMASMGAQAPKEIKGTQKVDIFGRVTEVKTEGANAGMMGMMTGGQNAWDMLSFFVFPEKAVAVGGTWEFDMPTMGGMFPKGSKLTGKLVGPGEVGDKKTWNLEFSGKPKMTMDIGKMMSENPDAQASGMPPMNIVMEGDNAMKIKVSIDQTTGQVLSSEAVTETVAKVKLVDMGMEFPVTAQSISKMVLRK